MVKDVASRRLRLQQARALRYDRLSSLCQMGDLWPVSTEHAESSLMGSLEVGRRFQPLLWCSRRRCEVSTGGLGVPNISDQGTVSSISQR